MRVRIPHREQKKYLQLKFTIMKTIILLVITALTMLACQPDEDDFNPKGGNFNKETFSDSTNLTPVL
jgi:hypothetical protein